MTDAAATKPAGPQEPDRSIMNPRNEPEITVRCRGIEFYHQTVLRKPGAPDFKMAISQARTAAQYVDMVNDDGSLVGVPHESQKLTEETGGIPFAQSAGMVTHERIGELETEQRRLEERLEAVKELLERERRTIAEETDARAREADALRKQSGGNRPADPDGVAVRDVQR